jgi:hypothetical protein
MTWNPMKQAPEPATLTLAEFLLARYADEEAVARDAEGWFQSTDWTSSRAAEHGELWDPARVLAECEAKREIVEAWRHESRGRDGIPARTPVAGALLWVMKQLAQPYSDHPDYRQEWRP